MKHWYQFHLLLFCFAGNEQLNVSTSQYYLRNLAIPTLMQFFAQFIRRLIAMSSQTSEYFRARKFCFYVYFIYLFIYLFIYFFFTQHFCCVFGLIHIRISNNERKLNFWHNVSQDDLFVHSHVFGRKIAIAITAYSATMCMPIHNT